MAKGNKFTKKGEKKKAAKVKKQETRKKGSSLSSAQPKLERKKIKSIIGVLFLLLAIYLFIAFLSYLFTWQKDQDIILSNTFFDFIFGDPQIKIANWLGKLGAWFANLFLYKWFGLSSFAFCFLFLISGVRLLLNIRLLPLRRTYLITLIAMLWLSIALGLCASNINYLGGAFGFAAKQWLTAILGTFGAILLVIVLLFIAIVALFNPDFKALYQHYIVKGSPLTEDEGNNFAEELKENNPIEEDEDDQEEEYKSSIKDEFAADHGQDEENTENKEEYNTDSQELEINSGEQTEEDDQSEAAEGDVFSVEVASGEKELTDSDLNKKVEEFGPYDPKLDLPHYTLPPIDLLQKFESDKKGVSKDELEKNKDKIVATLSNYKIEISKIKATIGPTVTLYEIIPAPGIRISKIKRLEDDIALSLAALGIRIIAPIPGKGTIGIEVPNSKPEIVSMRSLIASQKYQNSKYELPVVLGKTITNETFTFDLVKMPHLLVAGATGQGKSVGLNAILISLLYKKHPAQIKFVLIDPKKVELTLYNKIERHFLAKLPGEEEPIITDTSKVVNTLNSLCIEMDLRYDLLKKAHTRNIKEYNKKFVDRKLNPEKGHRYMPYIVVLIDEFSDLIMTAGKEVEHPIARIAQLARAIGIHLIVATQRPSVNVITGMIKANFPARIAFRVLSKVDSRTILDSSGADQLIGKGDMLISTGSDIIRLQCGFVDTPEVEEICAYIGSQRGYASALELPEYEGEESVGNSASVEDELDNRFVEAAEVIILHQQGSASLLQRKLKLGYNRAGRLIDQLETHGIVGPHRGSKARDVLISSEDELNQYLENKGIK